ncbi:MULTISPECIES: hypothetical protein [unclassified Morganella (in: enterobacteria)]|uniref:hypothetical protein n=1 Tax=unclassified Morganella (in: enterobacteria) TaxID=2676694 RepID=UPI00294336F4|nr:MULTISPECIES: hypothetical protein [unclassified Morganella (in: enterobacteria)]
MLLFSLYSYADCRLYSDETRSSNFIILGAGMINGPVKSVITTTRAPDSKNDNIIINGRYNLNPCGELSDFSLEVTERYPGLQNRMYSEGQKTEQGYTLLFTSQLLNSGKAPVTLIKARSHLFYNNQKQIIRAESDSSSGGNTPKFRMDTDFFYKDGLIAHAVLKGGSSDTVGEIRYDWRSDRQINSITSQGNGLPPMNYEFAYNDNGQVIRQTQTQHTPLGRVKAIYICQQTDSYGNCEKALWQSMTEGNNTNNIIVINTAIVTSRYHYY